MRYQNLYVWFVFVSALDVMFTWIVLHHDGWEVNVIANWVLRRFALPGLVVYKFALVVFVILLCEIVGRYHDRAGRALAVAAVALTCVPVLLAIVQLLGRNLALAASPSPTLLPWSLTSG